MNYSQNILWRRVRANFIGNLVNETLREVFRRGFQISVGAAACWRLGRIARRGGGGTDGRVTLPRKNFGAPPADVGGDEGYGQATQPNSSSLLVPIDRLESQMRQLNGEIEQLQFENRKLEDQLKKFQEDVDFRFQDSGRGGAPAPSVAKPQKRTTRSTVSPPRTISPRRRRRQAPPRARRVRPRVRPSAPTPSIRRAIRTRRARRTRSEAPASAAPPPLKDDRSSAGEEAPGPDTPLDLSGAKWRAAQGAQASAQGSPSQGASSTALATPGSSAVAALTTPNAASAGGAQINPVKEEFDVAYGYYRQREYETAEKSFAAFIQKNPKSKLTADATYYLGESFYQRNRPREAAEQYLKISTQYANSQRAPDAMLRLGQSLNALGAKEQACATFAEIPRKYPNAAANVKAEADREAKRVQC